MMHKAEIPKFPNLRSREAPKASYPQASLKQTPQRSPRPKIPPFLPDTHDLHTLLAWTTPPYHRKEPRGNLMVTPGGPA